MSVVLWIALCIAIEVLIIAVQAPIRARRKPALRVIVYIIKDVLILLLSYALINVDTWVTWEGAPYIGALVVALTGDQFSDLIFACIWLVRKIMHARSPRKQASGAIEGSTTAAASTVRIGIAGILCVIAVTAYGLFCFQETMAVRYTFDSPKLTSEHQFAFVSDTHLGNPQTTEQLQHAIDLMVADNPDFIVLGGDVVDEFASVEDMHTAFRLFGSTGIPTYYVYGNHDRQNNANLVHDARYTPEELRQTIEENGIVILDDKYERISQDLVILGRENEDTAPDFMQGDALAQLNPDPQAYLVEFNHVPYDEEDTHRIGAQLQVSGHTHAGQFFPLQTYSNLIGLEAYGTYQEGSTTLLVSAGEGAWRIPLRAEQQSEYLLVTLAPQQ